MVSKYKLTVAVSVAVIICALTIGLVIGLEDYNMENAERSFEIDHSKNTFLLDGKEFRYVAGSFHFFRALPQTWRTKLRTLRAGGLNAVDLYVQWSLHNPKDGVYNWEGMGNITDIIEAAIESDLYVILRPGPYICAEIDNGGLPYWLLSKYPGIQVRTSDANYLKEVEKWYDALLSQLTKYMYGNGGPIIMVQIENEYGAFGKCDKPYLNFLKSLTDKYVQGKAVLFTTDRPIGDELKCGQIEGVFVTTDFGLSTDEEVDSYKAKLREVQPTGPLVNTEFYTGWLTHWQEQNQRRPAEPLAKTLKKMLEDGWNVDFYMYFGGTNFGFCAGANDWGLGKYMADITSYDYDAPMDEAGDPTQKFVVFRSVISNYLDLPTLSVPDRAPKMKVGPVVMETVDNILSENGRKYLGSSPKTSLEPLSFEALNQDLGFVLYETELPKFTRDPSELIVQGLHDRAFVYIDQWFIGTLSRENGVDSLPISAGFGTKIQILVENQGRINFQVADDYKGILKGVVVQKYDDPFFVELTNWTMTGYPFEDYEAIKHLHLLEQSGPGVDKSGRAINGPVIFYGSLELSSDEIHDTYIDMTGWGKGFMFVNGFNLGRYWPLAGPQITLYLPKEVLNKGKNDIFMIELQKAPLDNTINFRESAILDGN